MRSRAKTSLTVQTERTIRSLIITLTAMIAVLSIVFLVTTSKKAQKGYALQQLRLESEHLQDESLKINQQITEATSFAKLKQDEKATVMSEDTEKTYITPEDNSIN